MQRFVALFDVHFGFERRNGHKVPIHDIRAINAALKFIEDFKPHHVVLGGDILDCHAISHHVKGKTGQVEGMRLYEDAKEAVDRLIQPLQDIATGQLIYHIGNHEDWLQDLIDEIPALEGTIDVRSILHLGKRWEVIEQGEASRLGKLFFIHGDQISGGVHVAKTAVEAYERNIRFGHFHTYTVHTKTSAVDANGHTGICVPCLCKKNPNYTEGRPNRWMQGFLSGYINEKIFSDQVHVIVDGEFIAMGKHYRG
jgi:hypothetical protein